MLCCWLCFRGSSVDFLADGSQGLSITVTLTSRLPNPLVFLHVSVTEDSGGGASLQRAALCCVRGSFLSSSSCEDTPETDQISSECLVYIWIQEIKRHYTAWLYVSFIVYRDIFALHVHLFMLARMRLSSMSLWVCFSISSWFSSCRQQDALTKGKLTSGSQLESWRKTLMMMIHLRTLPTAFGS